MSLIKNTRTVGSKLDASNFLQRVYDLFGTYWKQKIVIYIYTEKGAAVMENFEIQDNFDIDTLKSVFARNTNNVTFICTVEVLV